MYKVYGLPFGVRPSTDKSNIQLEGIEHFDPWGIFGLGVLKHFGLKKSGKKN